MNCPKILLLLTLALFASCTGTTDEDSYKYTVTSEYRVMGRIECNTCKAEDQMMIDITKPDDESYTYIGLPPFRDFGNGEFAVEAELYPGSTVRVFASIGGGLHVTKDVSVPDSSTRVINVVLKVE